MDENNYILHWLKANWKLSLYLVAFYLFFIFTGRFLMQNRRSFDLRKPLITWSAILSLFSFVGAYRLLPEMIAVWETDGFQGTICDTKDYFTNPDFYFWNGLFVAFKAPELLDTFFIVLRKQPLIFLHWYHHVTVLLYSWYSYQLEIALSRWFVLVNFSIHAIMYGYYAMKAGKLYVPKAFAMAITVLQVAQMFVGMLLNVWVYRVMNRGEECINSYLNIKLSLVMYSSYFVLFLNFFYKSYVKKSRKCID